jgi:hypothetical protein
MSQRPAGYSGTPLSKKLGIGEGTVVYAISAPKDYPDLLAPLPAGVRFVPRIAQGVDVVHLFVERKVELARRVGALRTQIRADAALWVSWPKKASKVPTDITEDVIREVALPQGFVDVKVCAVSDVWSGLKLVIRKNLRN